MKTYTKPIAEVKEFVVTNTIASIEDWLGTGGAGAEVGAAGATISNITSYSMTSANA